MRFTDELQDDLTRTIRDDPDSCVVFPASAYRDDGTISIVRDALNVRLHRHLYRLLIGELDRGEFLIRNCEERLCVNPFHRTKTRRPHSAAIRTHCPNGHPYSPETDRPGRDRCYWCWQARRERRGVGVRKSQAEINAAKQTCPHGHAYTEENTYRDGRGRRKCRICAIIRGRLARQGDTR